MPKLQITQAGHDARGMVYADSLRALLTLADGTVFAAAEAAGINAAQVRGDLETLGEAVATDQLGQITYFQILTKEAVK